MDYKAILNKRVDGSLKYYKENDLLTDEVISKIMDEHNLTFIKIYWNIYLSYNKKTIEFDVLIEAETPTGRTRWISVELKENDISKVIHQAKTRRDFVHYSYVVLNTSVKWIVQYLFYVYPDYIKNYKIGLFSNNIFILNSKYESPTIEIRKEGREKNDKSV